MDEMRPLAAERTKAMAVGEVCVREVLVAGRATTIQEAARLMRQHHVGDLVVVDGPNGRRVPTGIITDRDIVISVVATNLDPAVFTLGDLATQNLITAREDQGILETIQQMRKHGIRRMPIVDAQGDLVGIVSVDDLIQILAQEMGDLAKLISREQSREAVSRR
jgi:CBS domain-containing protein